MKIQKIKKCLLKIDCTYSIILDRFGTLISFIKSIQLKNERPYLYIYQSRFCGRNPAGLPISLGSYLFSRLLMEEIRV